MATGKKAASTPAKPAAKGGKPSPAPEPKKSTAVAVAKEEPKEIVGSAEGYDAADLGAGFENMTAQDFLMPFLVPLQKTHKQVEEEAAEYIEGAKPGMVMNNATNELYDGKEGIIFIPVHREHSFIEWIPRDQGGGLVGRHEPNSALVREAKSEATEFGKLKTPDQNDLKETFTVYGLQVLEDGTTRPAVISFSSTQIKAYRQWMTKAMAVILQTEKGQRVPAPLFAHTYRLTTEFRQNQQGSWYVWSANFSDGTASASRLPGDSALYQEAKNLRDMVLSGAAKADMTNADDGETQLEETDEM